MKHSFLEGTRSGETGSEEEAEVEMGTGLDFHSKFPFLCLSFFLPFL